MDVRRRSAGVLLVTLLALATGCGGGDDDAATAPASSSGPAAATSSSASSTGSGTDECGAALGEIEAGVRVSGFVTSVEVPTCQKAVVKTSLTTSPDDVRSAVGICGTGAAQGRPKGVASVSVVAADGTELASGTDSGNCAAAR